MTPAPEPSPRQTQSYIRDLLRTYGLMPKAKMGQNFLIDLNLLQLVVTTAELTTEDSVLEVGTGTGGLTDRLAQAAGAVTSVELDTDFHKLAKELLGMQPRVQLLHGDILAGKNELRPDFIEAWRNKTKASGCTRMKLVANLPYAVATPVIANLLISDLTIERMVGMVQLEMAERLIAAPNTKDYGALSVLVQSLAEAKLIRKLPPDAFWPKPAVDSAIVLVQPSPAKRSVVVDVQGFRNFLRDLYTHRRKILRQALSVWPGQPRSKPEIDALLAQIGIDGSNRAETLDVADHLKLFRAWCS